MESEAVKAIEELKREYNVNLFGVVTISDYFKIKKAFEEGAELYYVSNTIVSEIINEV